MPSSPTRDRLIDVAATRFWSQGFASTSLAEIVAEAEVHGGSLYHFFRTKEALLLAVLERHREELDRQVFAPALARYSEPVDRIFGVLEVYREFLEESGCSMGCPIGNLALEVSDSHPAVREKVAEIFDVWAGRILELLEEARGSLPVNVDLEGLSRFVLTVMEGGLMQAKAGRRLQPFDVSVENLRRYFDGLLKAAHPGRIDPTKPEFREV